MTCDTASNAAHASKFPNATSSRQRVKGAQAQSWRAVHSFLARDIGFPSASAWRRAAGAFRAPHRAARHAGMKLKKHKNGLRGGSVGAASGASAGGSVDAALRDELVFAHSNRRINFVVARCVCPPCVWPPCASGRKGQTGRLPLTLDSTPLGAGGRSPRGWHPTACGLCRSTPRWSVARPRTVAQPEWPPDALPPPHLVVVSCRTGQPASCRPGEGRHRRRRRCWSRHAAGTCFRVPWRRLSGRNSHPHCSPANNSTSCSTRPACSCRGPARFRCGVFVLPAPDGVA